jgi:hypothetical protein
MINLLLNGFKKFVQKESRDKREDPETSLMPIISCAVCDTNKHSHYSSFLKIIIGFSPFRVNTILPQTKDFYIKHFRSKFL